MGAALVIGLPTFFRALYDYYLLIFGGVLLLTLLLMPDGIMGAVGRLWQSAMGKRRSLQQARSEQAQQPLPAFLRQHGAPELTAADLSKHFMGLKAAQGLSMRVRPGEVHGLIGPNGSGKSTTINVLTGVYSATEGKVMLGAVDVTPLQPHQLAAQGVTRTFQNIQLFSELTVLENVMMGFHRHMRAGFLHHLLQTGVARREEEAYREQALEILRFVGLEHLAGEQARNLSYGQQRLVEIARALAIKPVVLMLDEPAAGLNNVEVHRMTELIREVARGGITLLIVEHHMEMVMELCEQITVLNFGQKIAEGRPDEVKAHKQVIEAYLGGEEVMALLNGEVRSGA